ncbi:MAG TPA: NAD-dependent epimerase/dehydratase family protein [Gaiellaceae bacterium]|jgi:GDP-L-fucose synthase|nr:NAD-dependent epimerase/dehydratase family protein [Gaiellaceae bacterium]
MSPRPSLGPVLVTGGGGFVGRNLVRALRDADVDVHAPLRADLDVRNRAAVERYLRTRGIETVVHAAGKVGGIAANQADPVGYYAENALAGIAVVQAADAAGVTRLLNLSSSCVYPRDRELLAEDDLLTGPLEPTNEGYALAKIAVGKLCEWVSERSDDRFYRTLYPCNLYGPHDHFGATAHLVAAALAKTEDARALGAPTIEIWGDGTARREFMHAADLCAAVLHVLPRLEDVPARLNVGPGVDHSVNEYYEAAAATVGWHGRFVHDLDRPVGMQRKLLDVSRMRAIGWEARVTLADGLADTYRWLVESRGAIGAAA